MRMRLRHLRSAVPIGVVAAVVVALGATVFALGITGQQPAVADGASWLWSRHAGETEQVNAVSGGVSLRQPVVDSLGHPVSISQNDRYVILTDLTTGRVTSIDLTRLGFSGSLDMGTGDDVTALLSGASAVVVNRTRGLVRPVDPATLQATGDAVQLPAPLSGGAFDASGRLWLSVPSQGTVVALGVHAGALAIERTEAVGVPGHPLAQTVLDQGALVVDQGGDQVAVVGPAAGVRRLTAPVALTGAVLPARTVGRGAAITLPAAGKVLAIADTARSTTMTSLPLPAAVPATGVAAQPAVSFADRVYVPDPGQGTVKVYSAAGAATATITVGTPGTSVELEVREEHLFINAPDTTKAVLVDPDGSTSTVDKYDPDPVTSPTAGSQPDVPPSDVPTAAPSRTPEQRPSPRQPKPSPGRVTPRRPGPPVPVTALAGDGRVRLSWGRANGGTSAVTAYTVTWEENGGGRVPVDGSTLRTTITGLTNGTAYRFRVFATNAVGDGPPALSEPVTPAPAPAPDIPQAPRADLERDGSGAYSGAVSVSWPAVATAADYVVTPLLDGEAGANPPQTVTGTKVLFAGLTLGRAYSFTVVARNKEGTASDPSPAGNTVVPIKSPAAPPDVAARQTGADTYAVTWGEADSHGSAVTRYTVYSDGGADLADLGGNARSATLTGTRLTGVRVVATNAAGDGPAGTATIAAVPAPKVTITGTSAGSNDVTVTFTVAAGGAPATCKVTVGGRTSPSCGSPVTVGGLDPATQYAVRVDVSTFAGAASDTGSAKTDPVTYGAVVTCNDAPTNPDPQFCSKGLPEYSGGGSWYSVVGHVSAGTHLGVVCKVHGDNQQAGPYNNNKEGDHFMKLPNGSWISYVWLTFDNGNNEKAIPDC